MPSLFFGSIIAGAATNLVVTRTGGLEDPLNRQIVALAGAILCLGRGMMRREWVGVGFAIGIAGMAMVQYAAHSMQQEPRRAEVRYTAY